MTAADEKTALDKVVITDAVYDKLLLWGNSKNLNSVSIFQIKKPFLFFIIESDSGAYFEVDLSDENLYGVEAYSPEKTLLNYFDISSVNGTDYLIKNAVAEQKFKRIFSNIDYDQECGDVAYLVKCVLNYVAEYREQKDRINKAVQVAKQIKKTNKKTIKRKIKIGVYYINDYQVPAEKQERQRHVESWSVRGHWRNLRNGMRTWIAQYDKGTGAKEAKAYTLD